MEPSKEKETSDNYRTEIKESIRLNTKLIQSYRAQFIRGNNNEPPKQKLGDLVSYKEYSETNRDYKTANRELRNKLSQ